MAQQKTNFITHTFGGGWATDFGPTFYGAPDQGLQFKIPYLTNAKNLVYEFDGAPPARPTCSQRICTTPNAPTAVAYGEATRVGAVSTKDVHELSVVPLHSIPGAHTQLCLHGDVEV